MSGPRFPSSGNFAQQIPSLTRVKSTQVLYVSFIDAVRVNRYLNLYTISFIKASLLLVWKSKKMVSLDSRPYTKNISITPFLFRFSKRHKKGMWGLATPRLLQTTRPTVLEFESCSAQQPTVEKSRGGAEMPPLRLGKVVAELNPQQLQTQPTN